MRCVQDRWHEKRGESVVAKWLDTLQDCVRAQSLELTSSWAAVWCHKQLVEPPAQPAQPGATFARAATGAQPFLQISQPNSKTTLSRLVIDSLEPPSRC